MTTIPKKKKNDVQNFILNRNKNKSSKSDVEHIFPIPISSQDLTPQKKQYVTQLQRQYLRLRAILLLNREKYDEIFGNLASTMDERGINAQQLASCLQKTVYYSNENE